MIMKFFNNYFSRIFIFLVNFVVFSILIFSTIYIYNLFSINNNKNYFESDSFKNLYVHKIYKLVDYIDKINSINIDFEQEFSEIVNTYPSLFFYKTLHNKNTNFKMIIYNTKTNNQITNIDNTNPLEYIETLDYFCGYKFNTNLIIGNYFSNDKFFKNYININTNNIKDYEIYFAFDKSLKEKDSFYKSFISYNDKFKYTLNNEFFIIVFFISIVLFSILIRFFYKKHILELDSIDKIPFDVKIFFLLISLIFYFYYTNQIYLSFVDVNIYSELLIKTFIILFIIFIVLYLIFNSISSNLTSKTYKGNLLYMKIFFLLKTIFSNYKIIKKFIIFAFIIILFKTSFLMYIYKNNLYSQITFLYILCDLIISILIFLWVLKFILDFKKTFVIVENISNGNVSEKIYLDDKNNDFKIFGKYINSISTVIEEAVEKNIENERFKTDLIVNISHDVKTPLTSIISYSNILKNDNLDKDTLNRYLDVIISKSTRLNDLLEELTDTAAVMTGNIHVEIQKICLNELILQAIGEYKDKLSKKELDLIYTYENNVEIFVKADGKHLWRIIENLLSNIEKYSLKSSRVYINLIEIGTTAQITIKNISQERLNIPSNDLLERFIQGDKSRSHPGVGLGLYIVKSLTELQKGSIKIEIDGDLFKTTLNFDLYSTK